MMKRFQITSESSTVRGFPRCPCGMGWTPIRHLPSCIPWSPSFLSQVRYKKYMLCPDTWLSLGCIWSYSHSEYKLNYLIALTIVQNRGARWTGQTECQRAHVLHCLANHRSWLINKAQVGDTVFGTLYFARRDQVGLLGFPQDDPEQSCGMSVIGSWSCVEGSTGKPVYFSGLRATICLANVTRSDFLDGLKGQV